MVSIVRTMLNMIYHGELLIMHPMYSLNLTFTLFIKFLRFCYSIGLFFILYACLQFMIVFVVINDYNKYGLLMKDHI